MDRIAAEADLNRALGTLRYLRGLRAAQEQKQRSPPTSPHKAPGPSRNDDTEPPHAAPDLQIPKAEDSSITAAQPATHSPKAEAPDGTAANTAAPDGTAANTAAPAKREDASDAAEPPLQLVGRMQAGTGQQAAGVDCCCDPAPPATCAGFTASLARAPSRRQLSAFSP